MKPFSYSAAYLNSSSQELFKKLGVDKELHMTTCFDSSATINESHNIDFQEQSATIHSIIVWNTPHGKYLIAELCNCDWSQDINNRLHQLGAVEDLPHKPHITLLKSENEQLLKSLQVLVGQSVVFDKHIIKNKGLESKKKPKI